jgi:putative ABC transport system substrate-binding protein
VAVKPRAIALVLLGLTMLVAPSILSAPAQAEQGGRLRRIGYLSLASTDVDKDWVAAFREGLRELGYVEGKGIVIEQRHAAGRPERLPGLAAELARLNVDVVVVYGGARAVQAVQRASVRAIPIVLTVSADPVGQGLATNLARPGGQVTGLSDFHGSLVPKRLELLKDVAPAASRIAVLLNPANPGALLQLKDVRAAALTLGVTVVAVELKGSGPADFDEAFAAIARERSDALLLVPDSTFVDRQRQIAELAIKHRLPAISTVRQYAENGLLMSYGTNFADLWRRAAAYVAKILEGANPGDLPIEQASKFELLINLRTARSLGLTIPPALLVRVDEVIE